MKKLASSSLAVLVLLASNAFAANGILYTDFHKKSMSPKAPHLADAGRLLYFGGPVISNPKIHTVYWGAGVSAEIQSFAPDFYETMVKGTYIDIAAEYSTVGASVQSGRAGTNQTIGRGSLGLTLQIVPTIANKASIDDSQIQAELERQIAAGLLPAVTPDSLYMLHFPVGMTITMSDGNGGTASSCQQFCAYHNGFKAQNGAGIYYGVMPDLSSFGCAIGCGSGSAFDRFTVSASHEVIEATTDAFPTPGTNPGYPQAWNTIDGYENSDLCQSQIAKMTGGKKVYKVQQTWSNKANACTSTATYTK